VQSGRKELQAKVRGVGQEGLFIIALYSLHHFWYRETRGQIKILAKSDKMHLSDIRRVHIKDGGPH